MRRDLRETCHNDKPGRNDRDAGETYEDEGGVRGGSRWEGDTCNSSEPCSWKTGKERSGSDGEKEVGRCG